MNTENFKFKGTFIIATKEFLEKKYGQDFCESKMNHIYPAGNILASSWYLALPLIQLLNDCAMEKNIEFRNMILEHTKYVMEKDLNGVYKFFMKLGGTRRVLNSLPQLAKSYSNWNNAEILANECNYAKVISTVPSEFQEFMIYSSEGAMNGVISVCGQKMNLFTIVSNNRIKVNGISYSEIIFEFKYE